MASQPSKTIHRLPETRSQQTYYLNAINGSVLSVMDGEDLGAPEIDIAFPPRCSSVLVQGRLAGDFYAEITGQKFCRAAHADTAIEAIRAAIAQVPA